MIKVNVNLGLRSCIDFRNLTGNSLFPLCFDKVKVQKTEPSCPFCNQTLRKAECRCSGFITAFNKLQTDYNRTGISVKATEYLMEVSAFIAPENISMLEVGHCDITFSIFDYGVTVSANVLGYKAGVWQLSEGFYNEKEKRLSFYMRKKGQNQVYLCNIDNINLSFAEKSEVILWSGSEKFVPLSYAGTKRYGAYRIEIKEEIIAVFSYEEYLQKLAALFKSEAL